jgi:predicted ATPase/DNA-binding CsgD family transcriptional regulator/transcriptional regulator with XRE-family HTH domain/tetratricopeptide (TPR) repeat protein
MQHMVEKEPPPLSDLIRRHRLAAGWSQEMLAERSGLSARTISELERGTRSGPRAESIQMLADALSLSEEQKAELIFAARPELRALSSPPQRNGRPATRQIVPIDFMLPVATRSLVGREREINELVSALQDSGCHLITLTGPGGVGKTRLALAVAEQVGTRGDFEVTLVSLASVTDPELVAPTIGQAFGLSDVDTQTLPERLAFVLTNRPVLLVLDNFEQLLPAGLLLSDLVNACPTLKLLVTSRVVLRLSTEREFSVAPLAVLTPGAQLDRNGISPAVRLFLERASLRESQLIPEELATIEAICRRVDGLPLAIELAAARVRLLTPSELLSRMDRALPLLTGGPRDAPVRLQTMRGAIAWSFDTLSEHEQALMCALSVFSGGFTLAAAEAISPLPHVEDTLTALESLLDQSLIRRINTAGGQARFDMLEAIREFGLEQLASRGNEQDARERHAVWLISRFTWPEPKYLGSDVVPPFAFPDDQDNLRAALRWSLERHDVVNAAHLCLGLAPYWHHEGFLTEARETVASILDVSSALPAPLRGALLGVAGKFALFQGDFQSARVLATEGLPLARSTGDARAICWHLHHLGWAAVALDPPSAVEPTEEMLRLHRDLQDGAATAQSLIHLAEAKLYLERVDEARAHAGEAHTLITSLDPPLLPLLASISFFRGMLALEAGELDSAGSLVNEALRMRRAEGNKLQVLHSLRFLGAVALARGNSAEAARCFSEALDLSYLLGSEHCKCYCFAEVAAVCEDAYAATTLLGAEAVLRGRLKLCNLPSERRLREQATARVAAALGDSRFGMAFDQGRLLSSADAYALAKGGLATTKRTPPDAGPLLTPREREVLILIARGKGNRDIAGALFVSRRTAATHVRNLFAKLDVHSRAEAAAWAVRNGIA